MESKEWDWSGWKDPEYWEPLLEKSEEGELKLREGVPDEPGVYIVCANRSITRLQGKDKHGMLTIGESQNLRQRLASFVNCITTDGATGHSAGWRFRYAGLHDLFQPETLWVSWRVVGDKQEAYKTEAKLLQTYLNLHKELPPLNYQFNWALHQS